MTRIIILFLSVSIISSCYNTETPVSDSEEGTEVISEDKPLERITTDSITIPNVADPFIEGELVTYESCAVYAGATDYVFSDQEGKRISVRVNHFDNKKTANTIMPDNMLESGEDLEGPPGANPEMVGKSFKLIYDDESESVVEVVLVTD